MDRAAILIPVSSRPSTRTIDYVGRFAPSPTGPLHFGSLVAAVGSFADALHSDGTWLVRIDDVDQTRSIPGIAQTILRQLEYFGFQWTQIPVHQSARKNLYAEIIEKLVAEDHAFGCRCTRQDVLAAGIRGAAGPVYPGTCRHNQLPPDSYRTIRIKTGSAPIRFNDRIAGELMQNLFHDVGDFVVKRADGYAAYQIAVVIDDHLDHVTDVVRGADLLASTPRQIHLQHLLGYATPRYAHLPLVLDSGGRKLSKHDRDRPVEMDQALHSLVAAWQFLGQKIPQQQFADVEEFWSFAARHWSIKKAPATGHYFESAETQKPLF